MTIIASPSLPTRLRALACALRRNERAVAYVEAAFTFPFLMIAGLGGLEIANLALANTRISSIALAAADNASRISAGSNLALPQVRESDVNDVFTGAQLQSGSLNLGANGRMILSSLETNSSGGQWIHWQRCYGAKTSYVSSYGTQGTGATGTSFAGMGPAGKQVKSSLGSPVMFVEIFYDYKPLVFAPILGNRRIRYTAAFSVRDSRDTTQIYNPAPVATVRNC
jgi:hypothetical protein